MLFHIFTSEHVEQISFKTMCGILFHQLLEPLFISLSIFFLISGSYERVDGLPVLPLICEPVNDHLMIHSSVTVGVIVELVNRYGMERSSLVTAWLISVFFSIFCPGSYKTSSSFSLSCFPVLDVTASHSIFFPSCAWRLHPKTRKQGKGICVQ